MSMDNIIIIPRFIENVNIEVNSLFEEIRKESNDYIMQTLYFNNLQEIFDTNLAYWTSICYPDIVVKERLYNITNFYSLLFIIDDMLENDIDSSINSGIFIKILEDVIEPISSLENIFKDIWISIRKDLSEVQQTRFIDYIKEWLEGAEYLSKASDIDINKYMHYRFKSIGANSSFISLEYGLNVNFQQDLNIFKNIHKVAGENIIFINDLFSYRKEFYDDKYNFNIVNIIMEKNNCNLQDAISSLEIDIKKNYEQFRHLYNEILIKHSNKDVKKYLDGLFNLIIGNLQWSCTSPRYHGINFRDTLINGAHVIFSKDKTIIVKKPLK